MSERTEHVFAGTPDARQSDDPDMVTSRFRPRYRALGDDEKALHDAIKGKATELEALFTRIPRPSAPVPVMDDGVSSLLPPPSRGRYLALATTSLEEAVMWAVKALTL